MACCLNCNKFNLIKTKLNKNNLMAFESTDKSLPFNINLMRYCKLYLINQINIDIIA